MVCLVELELFSCKSEAPTEHSFTACLVFVLKVSRRRLCAKDGLFSFQHAQSAEHLYDHLVLLLISQAAEDHAELVNLPTILQIFTKFSSCQL